MKKNIKKIILLLLLITPQTVLASGTSGCGILGDTNGQTVSMLSDGFRLIRFGIPILIILLGMVDLFKVVFSGEEKVYKESFMRFVKRVGIGMSFLFVPYILYFFLKISGVNVQYDIDDFYCGILETTSGVKGTTPSELTGSDEEKNVICTYKGKVNGTSYVLTVDLSNRLYSVGGSTWAIDDPDSFLVTGACRESVYVGYVDGIGWDVQYTANSQCTNLFTNSGKVASDTSCSYTGTMNGKEYYIVLNLKEGESSYTFNGVTQPADYIENWTTLRSNCVNVLYVEPDGKGEYMAYFSSAQGRTAFVLRK